MKVKECVEKLEITDKTSIWVNTDVNEHSFKIELEKLMSEYSNQNVECLKLNPRANYLDLVIRNWVSRLDVELANKLK